MVMKTLKAGSKRMTLPKESTISTKRNVSIGFGAMFYLFFLVAVFLDFFVVGLFFSFPRGRWFTKLIDDKWVVAVLPAFKINLRVAQPYIALQRDDLLRHHTEYFHFNAVEFIKTGPGPTTGQSFEKFPHLLVIQTITAIKHHALLCQCFGQIFGRFGFARASGSRRCSPGQPVWK